MFQEEYVFPLSGKGYWGTILYGNYLLFTLTPNLSRPRQRRIFDKGEGAFTLLGVIGFR